MSRTRDAWYKAAVYDHGRSDQWLDFLRQKLWFAARGCVAVMWPWGIAHGWSLVLVYPSRRGVRRTRHPRVI